VPVESAMTTTVDIRGWLDVEAVAVVGVGGEGKGILLGLGLGSFNMLRLHKVSEDSSRMQGVDRWGHGGVCTFPSK